MTFDEMLAQVQALLQREQRVSYRGLKRRFALEDEYLEDLKEELIGARRLAADEGGRFLVWTGDQEPAPALSRLAAHQSPAPPTEPHPLEAERRQLTVMFCDLVGSTALSTPRPRRAAGGGARLSSDLYRGDSSLRRAYC